MRSFILTVAALALCVSVLVACSPQDGSAPAKASGASTGGAPTAEKATPAPHQEDGTRRISIDETQKAIADGSAVVVDVRDEASYKTSHIKSAVSIPLQQFDKRMGELPKNKLIITYCA